MKKKHNLYTFGVILALVAGLIYMQKSSDQKEVSDLVQATKVQVADVELAYPSTYGIYEKNNSPYTKTLNTVVWYENTESNKSFFLGTPGAASEPPVTMSLDIYSNPNNLSPKELLGADLSYMFLKGPGVPVTLGGARASVFDWDGLYKGKSIMLNHKNLLYVFSVTSLGSTDQILRDFDLLLSSVSFK